MVIKPECKHENWIGKCCDCGEVIYRSKSHDHK